jgi:hypothetical protein
MTSQLRAAATLLEPLAWALLLAASAYVAGALLTRRMTLSGMVERGAIRMAAGLLALAHLGLALGLLGHLSRGPVLAALGGLHLLGARVWPETWSAVRAGRARRAALAVAAAPARRGPPGAVRACAAAVAVCAVCGMAALPCVVLSLYPPLGFDATLYHLPFAKAFAASGGLPFLPGLRVPVFPQLTEVLFTLALLLDGDLLAQLLIALATLLTAALLVAWGRSAFGEWRGAGWLAAAAFVGNPLVVYLAGSAYVEAGLTLWVTAALHAVHRYRRGAGTAWLVLAGAFAGAAAASKYLGLFFVAAIAVILAWSARRDAAAGRNPRPAVLFTGVALAVMAPWYGRILYYTGNPVFPFFPRWFGSSSWDPSVVLRPELEGAAPHATGALAAARAMRALAAAVAELLRSPWDLSIGWRAAHAVAPLSPVYLAALPLLAVGLVRDLRIRRLLLLAAAFAFVTSFLVRDSRYLDPALPLVSLATGAAIAGGRLAAAARRGLIGWLAAVLLLPGWLYAGHRVAQLGPPPVTATQRDALLARQLPLYPALRFLNRTHGSAYTAFGVGAENLQYYAAGRLLGDWTGLANFRTMPAVDGDPDELRRALRRLGADHLILPAPAAGQVDATARPAFRRDFQLRFADPRGRVFALTTADLTPGSRPREPRS